MATRGRVFLMSAQMRAAKEKHQEEVQALHALPAAAVDNRREKVRLEGMINKKVIEYNRKIFRLPFYYDLHGMTFWGAINFADREVHRLKKYEVLRLETGVGKHATTGTSVIQLELIDKFKEGFLVKKDPDNHGVLMFERI